MSEILFSVRDMATPDKAEIATGINRGDIIDYHLDGFSWSQGELLRPAWRIIRVNITLVEAEYLSHAEDDTFNNKQNAWTRARKLDLDNLAMPQSYKDWLADDSRAVAILVVADTLVRTFYTDKGLAQTFVGAG